MIQTQTKIIIKDNSGILRGRCINTRHKKPKGIGNHVSVAVTKTKAHRQTHFKTSACQDLLIIQTKKAVHRYDGSSVQFNVNTGVCVVLNDHKLQLGFKRINTTVPFELKKQNHIKLGQGSSNLIKLAKNLV